MENHGAAALPSREQAFGAGVLVLSRNDAAMVCTALPAALRKHPLLADKVASPSYPVWRLFLGDAGMAIDA